MQDIKTRQRKALKKKYIEREKTQVSVLMTQFQTIRRKRPSIVSWVRANPRSRNYPEFVKWFMSLKSMLRSKELLKLACIPNYGFEGEKVVCPKRLCPKNTHWLNFKEKAERLKREEINRQKAFIREVFELIHEDTFSDFYKGQKHEGVFLTKSCRQKIPASEIDKHIKKLKEFWLQLIGRIDVIDSDEDDEIEAEDDLAQNGDDQSVVEEVEEKQESIIDILQEYESKFQMIPLNQPSMRQKSEIIPANQSQVRQVRVETSIIPPNNPIQTEQDYPKILSPGGSRFNLYKSNHSVQQQTRTINHWQSEVLTGSQIENHYQETSSKRLSFHQRLNLNMRGSAVFRMEGEE